MLYVFRVDTGTMLSFDMNLALESVQRLKVAIAKSHDIPEDKQVLLISGGESLNPSARVCSYSAAGTDTNPIYLFSTSAIESDLPLPASIDFGSDSDLKEKVDALMNMPPTFMTVVARSQLAQQFYDNAKDQVRVCELLVHEQHLQQQGWAAVVANLEDITSAFKKRAELLECSFQAYMEKRNKQAELLESFNQDLELLRKIPVLKSLLPRVAECGSEKESRSLTLLEWISSSDSQSSLEMVAEHCFKGLKQFDFKFHTALMMETAMTLDTVKYADKKGIKGLEERLYGLDHLMSDAKKYVQEQADMAQSFLQNQNRAGNLNDPSVLPDLCESHRKQLDVMLVTHKNLRDIHRRCVRAKEELSCILHSRLQWIMAVERNMVDVDGKLVIYHENLKRLKKHLDVVQQIHLAPTVYLLSVAEVVRRRAFTKDYLKWARELSQQATCAYEAEVSARNEFMFQIGNHFLQSLFPGLEGLPAEYALQAPDDFDTELPDISLSDVELLRNLLPDVAAFLDSSAIHKISPLLVNNELPVAREVFVSAIEGVHSPSVRICNAQEAPTVESPTDDKDPESEPDTEEFEKVDQCPGLTDAASTGENVVKDDNAKIKEKVVQLQSVISDVREKHKLMVTDLRSSFIDAKKIFHICEEDLKVMITSLTSRMAVKVKNVVDTSRAEMAQHNRDILQVVQQKMADGMEETFNSGWNLVNQLCSQTILTLEGKLTRCDSMIEKLGKKLADGSTALQQLTLEHELELVNLREEHKIECASFETRINELLEELVNKSAEMKRIKDETEAVAEAKFQGESQRIVAKMEIQFAERVEKALKEKLEEVESRHAEDLKKMISETELKREQDRNILQDKYLEEIAELKSQSIREKQLAIEQLKETMSKAHQFEMETLKVRAIISMDRSPSDGSLEKIERPESTEPFTLEQQIIQLRMDLQERDLIVEDIRRRYEEQLSEMQERCDRSQEETFRLTKASLTAEKQVIFNEAVNHVTSEKDKMIQVLQDQVKSLKDELESMSMRTKNLNLSPTIEFQRSSMEQPGIGDSLFVSSTIEQPALLMEASTSTVPGTNFMDKISFLTCAVGDLVLLTYDHRHENYLVFTNSSTLYFLNSDCWEELGLSKEAGELRKNWVLGYVTEKEYCQAKKEHNRFRVPLGTRFYRIRVKQWTFEYPSRRAMYSSAHSVNSPSKK